MKLKLWSVKLSKEPMSKAKSFSSLMTLLSNDLNEEEKKMSIYKDTLKKNDLVQDLVEIFKNNFNKINELV
jgi:hypothetical protein